MGPTHSFRIAHTRNWRLPEIEAWKHVTAKKEDLKIKNVLVVSLYQPHF